MSFNKERYFIVTSAFIVIFLLSVLIPFISYKGFGVRIETGLYLIYICALPSVFINLISENMREILFSDAHGFFLPKNFWGLSIILIFWFSVLALLSAPFSISSKKKGN